MSFLLTKEAEKQIEEKLFALVAGAVELAVARYDLIPMSEVDEDGTLTEKDVRRIAVDIWNALCGHDTCTGEVSEEMRGLLSYQPEKRQQATLQVRQS